MSKLYFNYATMNAGKSTMLLQASYNYRERGMHTMLFTAKLDDRAGVGKIAQGNGSIQALRVRHRPLAQAEGLGIEDQDQRTIGLAGPWRPAGFPEPEMSWLLTDARHEGKGYAAEACKAVLAHVFADHGWTSLPSYIDTENAASRALALRLGARPDPASPSPLPGCETYRHHPAHNPAPREIPA